MQDDLQLSENPSTVWVFYFYTFLQHNKWSLLRPTTSPFHGGSIQTFRGCSSFYVSLFFVNSIEIQNRLAKPTLCIPFDCIHRPFASYELRCTNAFLLRFITHVYKVYKVK